MLEQSRMLFFIFSSAANSCVPRHPGTDTVRERLPLKYARSSNLHSLGHTGYVFEIKFPLDRRNREITQRVVQRRLGNALIIIYPVTLKNPLCTCAFPLEDSKIHEK